MKFTMLQENLRKVLWERIEAGHLTGLHLAMQTGFKQAHISNFLNRRRGLSLEGMDKILAVQHLSVLDLMDPEEINKRTSILPPSDDEFDNVAVTEPQVAAREAVILEQHVKEILKFRSSFLKRIREAPQGERSNWERFVIIRANGEEAMSMYPRILPGASLLLDRHYNSLAPYRKGENNIYAIRWNSTCTVKYVEHSGNHLILRPDNPAYPVELLMIEKGMTPADYIVGRICHIGVEV
jgi:transcriptional regulator with XRE-family HTH domain